MVDLPTPDQIIDAVRDAGWLLEQDSAHLLERHDFHTVMGWAYEDPDDPSTSREMDVHGYRRLYHSEEHKLTVSARVLVECKQSTSPYVLIGRDLPDVLARLQPTEHVLPYRHLLTGTTTLGDGRTRLHYKPAWTQLGLDALPGSPFRNLFRATQMTRLDRKTTWTADNRGIFTSLMYPLAKALRAGQKGLKTVEWPSAGGSAARNEWSTVALHFPIVVTSAPLYVIDATTEHITPRPAEWATMTRQLKTTKIDDDFNVDVVTYPALDAYLVERVVGFAKSVAHAVETDPRRFTSPEG